MPTDTSRFAPPLDVQRAVQQWREHLQQQGYDDVRVGLDDEYNIVTSYRCHESHPAGSLPPHRYIPAR